MKVRVGDDTVYAYTGTRTTSANAPAVVLVHGAAQDHSAWALQSRYLAHHAMSVYAVDMPGHGRSDGAALGSVGAIADWLVRFLDATGVRNAALVGHSLGALAVLDASARHPDRVSRIALLGPAVPMAVSDELIAAAGTDDHVAYELINGWAFGPRGQIGGNPWPGIWMSGNAMRLMERSRPGVLHTDLVACRDYASGLVAAASVRAPALVIRGARDVMAPPASAQALIGALADVRELTLEGCGHSMMSEAPDATLAALRSFLA